MAGALVHAHAADSGLPLPSRRAAALRHLRGGLPHRALRLRPRLLHAVPVAPGRCGPRHHLRRRPQLQPNELHERYCEGRPEGRVSVGLQRGVLHAAGLYRRAAFAPALPPVGAAGPGRVLTHRGVPAHGLVRHLPLRLPLLRCGRRDHQHPGCRPRLGVRMAARPRGASGAAGRRRADGASRLRAPLRGPVDRPRHRVAGGGRALRRGGRGL